ncbi:hypothetical protein GDO86_014292 [Hymenochirus boettgeri]|uniref:C2H2-type domain-containing protein n=1 Tax=Hymenochirus boettgeri TaxID=247094 RepID=A0A8T2JTM7_9PIPI|nr:hypothetical protein GDO86_014292 [Hymenochirus boettgeri]
MKPAGQKPCVPQIYRCPAAGCLALFKKQSRLQDHMAGHGDQKPWKCNKKDCGKAFARKSQIQRHVKLHLGLKKYSCSTTGCKAAFKTKRSLKRHNLFKHGDPVPLKCSVSGCNQSFRKKRALRIHLLQHNNCPPTVCDLDGCEWKSTSSTSLVAHHRRHRGYHCSYKGCQTAFPTWTSLQEHLKKHPLELQCKECKKTFKKPSALRRHKSTHVKKPLKLHCPREDCGKTFTTMFNLTHHVRKTHLCLQTHRCYHSGCNRSFAMRESLIRHLVVHDPEKKKLKLKFTTRKAPKTHFRCPRSTLPLVEQDLSRLFSQKLLFHFKTRTETNLSGLFNERQLRDPAEPEVNLTSLFQLPPTKARAEKVV